MNYLRDFITLNDSSLEMLVFIAVSAVKATVLLGFVALFCLAFRRLSAATRHLLWSTALCASLLLPFLSVVKIWEIPVIPAQVFPLKTEQTVELPRVNVGVSESSEAQTQYDLSIPIEAKESGQTISDFQPMGGLVEIPLAPAISNGDSLEQNNSTPLLPQFINWAIAVWFVGAFLLLLRLFIGFAATNLLARKAVEFEEAEWTELFSSLLVELNLKSKVRLRRSERTLMPIVCGIFRPVVLVPESADEWSAERRRMVLLHELTHVARRDCLTQMLAQAACAIYWFNPFVWYAARRLRIEREQACDDFVLSIGTKPSDYAHHLLEIARSLQQRSVFNWSQTTTVAMARKSQLEGRLLAILSKENKRSTMSRLMTTGIAVLMFTLVLSLAIIRPTVSSGQDSQLSQTNKTEKSLFEMFSATDSKLENQPIVSDKNPQEQIKQQENKSDEDLKEQISTDTRTDRDVERYIERDTKPDIERDVAEETAQSPEVQPQISLEANPFINAKYEQEPKSQSQNQSSDFIDEMASVGYTNLSIDELIRLKTHGVTAHFVRSLTAVGLSNLTTKELANLRIHGVTPAFVETVRSLGYQNLTAKEFTKFRIHNITPEFIGKLKSIGYDNLPAKQLVDFSVHRVTPDFISGMRAAGYGNLSPKELVSLRVMNVTPEFARTARNRLGDLTIRQIIELKRQGFNKESGEE